MSLYRPKKLREILDREGLSPTRSLSQNFLIDGNILRKIIALADLGPESTVLEIGPGPGALTEALLMTGARVIAVEKDKNYAAFLQRYFSSDSLTVLSEDALTLSLDPLLDSLSVEGKISIIANLPYHLSSPLLCKFLPQRKVFQMILMLQDEFAKRCIANIQTSDYSRLTLFVRYHAKVHYAFKVSPRSFYPAPRVNSAVLQFHPQENPYDLSLEQEEEFFLFLKRAFGQKRKTLRASLGPHYGRENILASLETFELSSDTRPENLLVGDFVALFYHCCIHRESKPFFNEEAI